MHDLFHRRHKRLASLLEQCARVFYYGAVFLVPLAYLPWTTSPLEINKQTILVVCALVCAIAWGVRVLLNGEMVYKKSLLNPALWILIGGITLSTLFSRAVWLSAFGDGGQEYMSLLTWFATILLFFIGIQILEQYEHRLRAFTLFMSSISIILCFGVLRVFGIAFFDQNFVGAPNALGVVAVVGCIIGLGFLLLQGRRFMEQDTASLFVLSVASWVCAPTGFVLLWALDYWVLWAITAVCIATIFGFMFVKKLGNMTLLHLLAPVTLFVLCLIFIFMPTPGLNVFPLEIAPTYSASWEITRQALGEGSLFFGSGPGTFELDYHLYKTPAVNADPDFWDVTFNRSGSHILTLLAGFGILPVFAYLFFIVLTKMRAGLWLHANSADKQWFLFALVGLGWGVLGISQVFYSSNMTLHALFWFLSTLLWSSFALEVREVRSKKSPAGAFGMAFLCILFALSMLTTVFVTASRYVADVAFARAASYELTEQSMDSVIGDLQRAVSWNKWNDVYARNFGYGLFLNGMDLLTQTDVNPNTIEGYMANSIFYAKRAVALSPNRIENHVMLGGIYKDVSSFVSGADLFAIASYKRAVTLSPTNPKYLVYLGRAYLKRADVLSVMAQSDDSTVATQAQDSAQEAIEHAMDAFNRAIALRSSYATAQYYLALAYERSGNLSEAIARLQSLRQVSPYDAGLAMQIGLLYLHQGKLTLAQEALEYAVELSPEYSNARWFLSSVYEQQGDFDRAIEQVEIVLTQNPENTLIENRLIRLQKGLVSGENIEPLEDTDDELILE